MNSAVSIQAKSFNEDMCTLKHLSTNVTHLWLPPVILFEGKEYKILAIANDAFILNINLTHLSFSINTSIKTIKSFAFRNCQIKYISFYDLPLRSCHIVKSNYIKIIFSVLGASMIGKKFVENNHNVYRITPFILFQGKPKTHQIIRLRESIEKIGANCFIFSRFKGIIINKSLAVIGEKSFYMANFDFIVFPYISKLKTIEISGFEHTTITSIFFPSSLRVIQSKSFFVSQLKKIEWPINSQCIYIGAQAFGFTKITQLLFPNSLEIIQDEAFISCTFLESITFPSISLLKSSANSFKYCKNIKTLVYPKHIITVLENDNSLAPYFID